MFDIAMNIFWSVCSIAGILMIVSNFLRWTAVSKKIFEFMKRHRTLGVIFVVLGAIGIIKAIIFG